MLATVRPRVVAAPWAPDHEIRAQRRVAVHREAHVTPEPGPLAEYLRVFPHRRVLWNVLRQLFEIRETDPDTGRDERVGFVFTWEPHPETGQLTRVFRHFDYDYVAERKHDWYLLQAEGGDALHRRTQAHNDRVAAAKLRDAARESAAGLNEIRRYLPVLAALHAGVRPDVALTEKAIQVSPGVSLTRS